LTDQKPPQPTTPPQRQKRGRPRKGITFDDRQEIQRLHACCGTRRIAQRMSLTRWIVQQVIKGMTPSPVETPSESKLHPFLDEISTKANPAGFAIRLFGPTDNAALDEISMADTVTQATVALPGDCVSVVLDNLNLNGNLITPALTFDLAL